MSFTAAKKDYAKYLDLVLPEYKKISEATDDPSDPLLYKSVDALTGEVYLVRNPAAWNMKVQGGKTYRYRPEAQHQGNIMDLPRSQRSVPTLPTETSSSGWGDF
jgi:hypothetical protein